MEEIRSQQAPEDGSATSRVKNDDFGISAADRAYLHLRDAILSDHFERGARLREEHLAKELEMSRTPVREALRRLGAEGLVVIDTHRGAQVTTWKPEDIDQIYSVRTLIEGEGARLAAMRITDEELARLTELMEVVEEKINSRSGQIEEATDLNLTFHRSVLEASGNERLLKMFGLVVEFSMLYRAYRSYSWERLVESFDEHRTLVRALAAHDSEWAEAVMRMHVLSARHEERRISREHHKS